MKIGYFVIQEPEAEPEQIFFLISADDFQLLVA